ncbi:venom acid phosphatase Acph-1 [Diachasma alloeum]|uniref:venom acid phosphatase Acph-1 n=1 Tax=Diachasma alloeum TaxID=454923 RepID=UPI0007383567|nr:venom acid phosphatase Acph-1 [Diachasma alloeum]
MSRIPLSRIIFFLLVLGVHTIVGLQYKLVNVVFRHGDRTPLIDDDEPFPTSPYLNWTFYPFGSGQLTNAGKQREYDLGVHIRERYRDFLGDIYNPRSIIARSSDYDRTKMSLQLVTAGMFPPAPEQRWRPALNWQPVIANYVPYPDSLLRPMSCPRYKKELKAVEESPEVQLELSKYKDFMEDLTALTEKPIKRAKDVEGLYNGLMALYSMGLPLPEWTEGIFPYGIMHDAATLNYRVVSWNRRMKMLNGGMLLKNFTDNMFLAATAKNESPVKMVLLSGHEINLTALLDALGVYKPHVPAYSSAMFVELLEDNNEYYVRIFYYLGIPQETVQVNIPKCGRICPLSRFIKLYSDIFPSAEDVQCVP